MIEIKNISKYYNDIQALKEISLSVEKGELFGLIGPDGAGKTTLMRILMTLLLPDSGEAKMNDLHVVKDFKKIRHIVGYMPGRFSLYQDLSVEENLHFFATVFGTTIEENYDLIRDIYYQIEPFKNRRAGKLSGGMKQKLALSCALIHKPKILILDEPTTGVDAVSRKEFWEMLKALQQKEITILVSTPYMDEASLCDRVALIQKGTILDVDSPSRITEKFPRKNYPGAFRRHVPPDTGFEVVSQSGISVCIWTVCAFYRRRRRSGNKRTRQISDRPEAPPCNRRRDTSRN